MPNVTETSVDAYVHCPNVRCPGGAQRKVDGIARETAFTYRERGVNAPGVEQSHVQIVVGEEDRRCPHCDRSVDVSDKPRKNYANLSGHDQGGLLGIPRFDPAKQAEQASKPVNDSEREEYLQKLSELEGKLAALEATKT